jgi:hypothetical protein
MPFVNDLIQIATDQWNFFEKQTYDLSNRLINVGRKEGEDGWFQRVGKYWVEGTDTHGIDGRNHESAWSATFISWVAKQAGAGSRFRYSMMHSVYISQAIRDKLNGRTQAGYWGFRLNEVEPTVGDLICWSRQSGIDYDHQAGGVYKGHSDIIVEVQPSQIFVIGGNVGDSVSKRTFKRDSNGFVAPARVSGETLFALMQNRIA